MSEFNQMQTIKRQMFALRNGIIADTLRKANAGYKIVFGLNIPQVQEVASSISADSELAEQLWADKHTRESLLLAPMIFPRREMTFEKAMNWISEIKQIEVADNLCHKLLRHLPFAWEIAKKLVVSDSDMERYTAIRLMWNLVGQLPEQIIPLAEAEVSRNCSLTRQVAASLVEEARYLISPDE